MLKPIALLVIVCEAAVPAVALLASGVAALPLIITMRATSRQRLHGLPFPILFLLLLLLLLLFKRSSNSIEITRLCRSKASPPPPFYFIIMFPTVGNLTANDTSRIITGFQLKC